MYVCVIVFVCVSGQAGEFRKGGGEMNLTMGVEFARGDMLLAVADEQNACIWLLDSPLASPRGALRTLAGGSVVGAADGTGGWAQFNQPVDVAFSPDGQQVAVADKGSHRIRMVAVASGEVVTLAGSLSAVSGYADGVAAQARFNKPSGVAFSPDGVSIAIADAGNNVIRLIAMPASELANATVTTLAGNSSTGFEDGVEATFSDPRGVSFSPDGMLLAVADQGNNAIRIINIASGSTQTVAGHPPFSTQLIDRLSDGAGPSFYQPVSVSFSPNGKQIVVGDSGNHAIRLIGLDCTDCENGTYKDSVGSADCVLCTRNSTSRPGSSSSSECQCRPGFVMKSGACSVCKAGTFNPAQSATACLDCPAGSYSTDIAAVLSSTCKICPGNAFSSAGTTSKIGCFCLAGYTGANGDDCSACESGYSKPTNGSAACAACDEGTYSNYTGVSACTSCDAGTFSNARNALLCVKCDVGKYSLQEASNCTNCPMDTMSAEGSGDCTCNLGFTGLNMGPCSACGSGTYKSVNGSSTCLLCPNGKYWGSNASSACSLCPAFATSSVGSIEIGDCECAPGYTETNSKSRNDCGNATHDCGNVTNSSAIFRASLDATTFSNSNSSAEFFGVECRHYTHSCTHINQGVRWRRALALSSRALYWLHCWHTNSLDCYS